MKAAGTVPFM